MGVCTSDPMGLLANTYGDDLNKYFLSLNSQRYLHHLFPQLTQNIIKRFDASSQTLNHQFDAKEQTIRNYFDTTLTKSLKESRTAIQGIKKREQTNEEEIFGLTNIHSQFIQLRMNKDQKLQEHKQNLMKILNLRKEDLKQQILRSRQEVPMLQQMPFWLRSQVEESMADKLKRQLRLEEERLLNSLQRSINLQKLEESIRMQAGMQEADELAQAAHGTFLRIKRNLTYYNNPKSCFS